MQKHHSPIAFGSTLLLDYKRAQVQLTSLLFQLLSSAGSDTQCSLF